MKKYLTGIIAIILAVGTSAFSTSKSGSGEQYYWYYADYGYLMSYDKSEMPPNGCPLQGGELCAYGHSEMTEHPFFNPDIIAKYPWY
jgi:hypothetical protein